MESVKVSWSGGKDSTAAVLLHLAAGHHVTAVCYVPMFDAETPLISRAHFDFIQRAADIFRSRGAEVLIVTGMTYEEYCTHVSRKGKFKGQIFGFPTVGRGQCGFKRDSKLRALQSVTVPCDYEDIGIAADEYARHAQLTALKRSILYEQGYTERDARDICVMEDLLSPLYTSAIKRDGCALCPNAKEIERQLWYQEYPGAREKLLALQSYVLPLRPDRMPLRGYKPFL